MRVGTQPRVRYEAARLCCCTYLCTARKLCAPGAGPDYTHKLKARRRELVLSIASRNALLRATFAFQPVSTRDA